MLLLRHKFSVNGKPDISCYVDWQFTVYPGCRSDIRFEKKNKKWVTSSAREKKLKKLLGFGRCINVLIVQTVAKFKYCTSLKIAEMSAYFPC